MSVANLMLRAGRSYAERPAVAVGPEVRLTYGALARRVAGLAGALRGRFALAPGDRVALIMANGPAYLEVMFAAWHAGLVAMPINAKLHAKEHAYILDHAGARLCFVSADLADEIAAIAPSVDGLEAVVCVDEADYEGLADGDPIDLQWRDPGELAWLFYTSGTTGRPKGAMLSHRNLMAMTTSYFIDVDTIAPEDCIIHAAPMSHGSGMYMLPHVAAAAKQVIPASGGFDPGEIVDLIAAHRGVSFFAAPTMVTRLVDDPAVAAADTANLKTIVYGGGPMYVADCRRAMAVLGNKLAQIYGQGESPMTITALNKARHADTDHPRYLERLASVGVAHTVAQVRVADADDRALPAGEIGEVLVRGDIVMSGYWRNPDATAEALRGGWLHTGDVGAMDADGYLTLKDRSKDVIISGGSNIYPREVEEVLLHHPDVQEVAVIGRPHPEWGEEVVAVVVPRPDTAPEEAVLDRLCLDNIARFKRPKNYHFVEALPKNNYGKVLKTELRRLVGEPQP